MLVDQDKCEVNKNARKNEAGWYPAIFTKQTWSVKDLLLIYPKREPFLSEPTARWARLAHSDNKWEQKIQFILVSHAFSCIITGLSIRAGGGGGEAGILPSYYEYGPQLLSLEDRRKIEPKEIPSCLIRYLLVVSTWQLEILVTTLY